MKWFINQESFLTIFAVYSIMGLAALLLWWVIYQVVLARKFSVMDAIFGQSPNAAVALDFLGGMLATGILFFFLLQHPTSRVFWTNVFTVGKSLIVLLVLLALLRIFLDGIVRIWFGSKRDAQGDVVSLNNELFNQRNFATSIFFSSLYLILVAGMLQVSVADSYRDQITGSLNMVGVWLIGAMVVLLHSFLFLGYGTRNHILHECFHDNNPAAATSLLGLIGGVFILTNHILSQFKLRPGVHIFNSSEIWLSVGTMLLLVLLVRAILQLVVFAATRLSLRKELVVRDNVAWGMLDGGLIFILCLILVSFL